ncbi:MAG: RDD family protein [Acidobacteriota bacterium]|nr:RDD family protein [Acidobacteriota bacterium]
MRCGRRIGMAMAAPAGYSGANALAIAPTFQTNETQELEPNPPAPAQPRLFKAPAPKVIAFDDLRRHLTGKLVAPLARAEDTGKSPASHSRKPAAHISRPAPEQTAMDFVPVGVFAQRTLKTAVPAQIYCELPVATPTHRFVASLLDASMILLAFGLFVGATELTGGSFGEGKLFWITVASALALISMFYGLLWAILGRETAGMHWTDLQLITFDGFPVDARSRASRVASTWLSFCSGGLGLIWAVADEENLTWHDHISKTFPTIREVPKSFVRPPRRS